MNDLYLYIAAFIFLGTIAYMTKLVSDNANEKV